VKDLFDVPGVPTCAGSTFLPEVRPTPATGSALVRRLRALGSVIAGKTHLVEFASGLTGENPHYGDCPHPHFPDRLTGGSSSGSAALLAAGIAPLALGTDTGGSVRVPAAFCGLFGFRLTPGDAFIRDAFPLSPSMDTAGWFTTNAGDLLEVTRLLADLGPAAPAPRGCFLPLSTLVESAEAEVAHACEAAAARFCPPADDATRGALREAWHGTVDAYVTIGMSEAHAVHRDWLGPFRERYDPVIWQRFHAAGANPSEQVASARETMQRVRDDWRRFFAQYDFLVLPAVSMPAPRKSDCTPELRRAILTLTAPASLGGLPVLSVPVALPSGLTAGLQIIAATPDSPVFAWALESEHARGVAT
jgi:amidase/aspartyl-tRNA(Asn)/glutamyl-tRNA(Gln) amidotransferase subunit A